ncbi:DNA polymerase III subunit delta [Ferrovibrio sp.]|uniref:DNA polymerase III subunit delta n=1 Tax=Ferrovibrio sp. TaxID=1917215 RepID=UPI0025BC6433|nr:DNA polymerase III subunit delta [Ferrovibrio sp.]MBX3455633.1 DNA polymerase III subunit delta [Ferrovibrio sp.]
MKLAAREVEGFLRKPPANLRAALFFGPDLGLVRERAKAMAKTVAPDLTDAFQVATITAAQLQEDPARLADEAAQISMLGGRRVVMLSGLGDKHAKLLADFLSDPPGDALVVAEAGDLSGRSSLVKAFEGADTAVAVACYADDPRVLAGVIQGMIEEAGRKIDRDAVDYLVEHLGTDRMITRGEIQKLLLYKGDEAGNIDLADCEATVGDSSAGSLDDAAFAAFGGDIAGLTEALSKSEQAGESPVAILRVAQKHAQRLHLGVARMAQGNSDPKFVAKSLGVFWKREDAFLKQLRLWNNDRLLRALDYLTQAELDCKTTGMPSEAATGDALLRIARAAQVGARPAAGGRR